ncbi:MAG: CRISPR-associated protein Cas4 [Armatimonadota bacterium]|nr:CRISPR-associated protein Cas4 [Armatimonadota bacterium]
MNELVAQENTQSQFLVRVSDIKQWLYCPRVVYFTYVMPVRRKVTTKMKVGLDKHEVISALERRRKLREYGIIEGKRLFHVALKSQKLGLTGVLDLLLIAGSDYYPVDFKDTTRGVFANHKYQLAGYALLIESEYSCRVQKGFIYQIPDNKVYSIAINEELKAEVCRVVREIREMIAKETMPQPPAQKGKCIDCEFLNFCGDRF